jgi:hypothetical protein
MPAAFLQLWNKLRQIVSLFLFPRKGGPDCELCIRHIAVLFRDTYGRAIHYIVVQNYFTYFLYHSWYKRYKAYHSFQTKCYTFRHLAYAYPSSDMRDVTIRVTLFCIFKNSQSILMLSTCLMKNIEFLKQPFQNYLPHYTMRK